MTTDVQPAGGGALQNAGGPGLAEVLDTILDKGIVIDAYVQASLVGIDILTVNARVVVASVDTYLRFAEAVNRLDLTESKGQSLTEAVGDVGKAVGGVTKEVTGAVKPALGAADETLREVVPGEGGEQEQPAHGTGRGG